MQKKYFAIGVMSGTSLDGLDIAFCEFEFREKWKCNVVVAETIDYSDAWRKRLFNADNLFAREFMLLDAEYGNFIGDSVISFIKKNSINPDFIASHGHTVFHQPALGFTTQIGCGANIAAKIGVSVICDFRSLDVACGGQGAPLVPIGDQLLFPVYDACLNLGGFSNISFELHGKRIAFDICPVNIVLNHISKKLGFAYDNGGEMARSGRIDISLLEKLNQLEFYTLHPPKSLGKEWTDKNIIPLIDNSEVSEKDKLRTFCEHIALQISLPLNSFSDNAKMLVTGGGAYNSFLMERIKIYTKINCIIPDSNIINYKEALIFAFLGLLRFRNEINCLSSVTGAKRDSVGGAIYFY